MWQDQESNPGPLTCKAGPLPTALCGPAMRRGHIRTANNQPVKMHKQIGLQFSIISVLSQVSSHSKYYKTMISLNVSSLYFDCHENSDDSC